MNLIFIFSFSRPESNTILSRLPNITATRYWIAHVHAVAVHVGDSHDAPELIA